MCISIVGAVAVATAQERAPSFVSSSTEIVVLPVVVSDKQGRFVADIARERFTVFDNGRRQEVALFSNEDTPVTVGLVMDHSGSMVRKLGEVIAATLAFARLSNPADELFTLAFNDTVRGDMRPLPAGTDVHALEGELRAHPPEGQTALYDALNAALIRAEQGTHARKALIVMSDGGDNASHATRDEVLTRARQSNVTIFTIGLFDDEDPDRNPGLLNSLAQSTGGERFLPRSPSVLLQSCERIARELRSGYTLGYVPPDRDGAYHRVRVEVRPADRGKLNVRTRPGYFASSHLP